MNGDVGLANLTGDRTSKVALLADDELSNRVILRSLLKKTGFEVLEAENGQRAVELFQEHQPDIIFMDIMMPVMDGYEATRRIKEMSRSRFVPVLFLTAMTEEDALVRCVEVGGDDFLTKPYSHAILRAKIKAMDRIRVLQEQTRQLVNRMQRDQEIAEQVFNNVVIADNVATDRIKSLLKPADLFSGDVLLSEFTPARALNVLLGDFTGHGLAAALGALPVSQVFRSMTLKGFSPEQILASINSKLNGLLPTGMFMAAQMISIDPELNYVTVFNCGMPDILVRDGETGRITRHVPSKSLPLGVLPRIDMHKLMERVQVKMGDSLLLVSDGVTEARGDTGEMFGRDGFIKAVESAGGDRSAADLLEEALETFCGDLPQDDDISFVEVPIREDVLPQMEEIVERGMASTVVSTPDDSPEHLALRLRIGGPRLANVNPVPLMVNQLEEIHHNDLNRAALYTVLTELYVNALDHGVLGLDSSLKSSPEGFTAYFAERDSRLAALKDGYIDIAISCLPENQGGHLLLEVEDSGPGFDLREVEQRLADGKALCGRGISLVRELSEEMKYEDAGSRVRVVMRR